MRSLKVRASLAIILLLITPAFAQAECSTIRLDQGNGPYAQLPVYDQTFGPLDPGICYAVTAALLRDASRIQAGDYSGRLSAPISLALHTRVIDSQLRNKWRAHAGYDDSDPVTYLIGGGQITDALKASQGQPVCDQRWLEPELTSTGLEGFLAQLADRGKSDLSPEFVKSASLALTAKCESHAFISELPLPMEMLPPGGDILKDQQELIMALQKSPGQKRKLVEAFRKKHDPVIKIRQFGGMIDRLLQHPKSSGVAIGFLYRALKNKNEGGVHAAIIVGRRTNPETKKCEYLVRDSYGPNCKDEKGEDRYRLPCENGSVWVDARELLFDTVNLTWIPPSHPRQRTNGATSEAVR